MAKIALIHRWAATAVVALQVLSCGGEQARDWTSESSERPAEPKEKAVLDPSQVSVAPVAAEALEVIEEVDVRYESGSGAFVFEAVPSAGRRATPMRKPGLGTLGFAQVNSNNLTFATPSAARDLGTYTLNGASQTCPAMKLCGAVTIQNVSGLAMRNTWVEVTSITSGFTVNNSMSASVPPGYAPPLVTTFGVWSFGDIANNATSTQVDWRFDLADLTTTFAFRLRVLGTFDRTSYSAGTWSTPSASAQLNACNFTSFTRLFTSATDDGTAAVILQFPINIYGTTQSRSATGANVSTNGVFMFGTASAAYQNTTLPNSGTTSGYAVPRPAIFAFWDDLHSRANRGVCYGMSGTSPNRKLVVTWDDFRFYNNDTDATSGSHLTFSLIINEGTDDFTIQYLTMTANTGWNTTTAHATRRTWLIGADATIGVQDSAGTTATALVNSGSGTLLPFTGSGTSLNAAVPTQVTFTASPTDPPTR